MEKPKLEQGFSYRFPIGEIRSEVVIHFFTYPSFYDRLNIQWNTIEICVRA
jgi:hypothetical protein